MVLKNKMRSKQRKKQQNLLIGNAGEDDKISKLPDTLIHHMLSFLPTKYAVRTNTLSKRWRNVWVFTPVLNFRELWLKNLKDEKYLVKTENFMNSVDRMLSFQDNMPNIKKLHLVIQREFDVSRVNGWISTVVRRKVEELIIEFMYIDPFTSPPCVFTCESLTMLDLSKCICLVLPESISFPMLKILRLSDMMLVCDESIQQLFSNSPVLEELILKNCCLDSLHILSICAPTLKFLSIEDSNRRNENLFERSIKIYAPNLLSLKYIENVAGDFDLSSFPSLVDAEIKFIKSVEDSPKTDEETGYAASKLIAGLLNIKLLKLSGNTFKVFSFVDDLLTTLPTFYNLIRLEVTSEFPCSNKTLFSFLQIMPNLESLVFAMGFERGLSKGDKCWTPSLIPQCLLLHLKSVEFQHFHGHPRERNAVQLFLKNAEILERMTIIFYSTLSTDVKSLVKELLQMHPRSSTRCVIKVS